jgi:galactose mutarotase-like enzyme
MGEVEPRSLEGNRTDNSIERIVLENSTMRVTVLPALGGKIASIVVLPGGEELLQQPLQPYALRTRYMTFDASDASGWDECLPSVAACEVQTASGTVSVPDHGDFWQVEWETISHDGNGLEISADGFSLPLRFNKILHLDGNRLRVDYRLLNLSDEIVEYVWSAHPLFAVEQGDRIVLPDLIREVTVEGSAQQRLGKSGRKQAWPIAATANGDHSDLSVAGNITDGVGDKVFAASPHEGWCAIERKGLKRRIELRFDPQESPWLGLWICYGGWPENGARRQQCVALEACTAEGDSLAVAAKQGRARSLSPRAEHRWSLEFQVGSVS